MYNVKVELEDGQTVLLNSGEFWTEILKKTQRETGKRPVKLCFYAQHAQQGWCAIWAKKEAEEVLQPNSKIRREIRGIYRSFPFGTAEHARVNERARVLRHAEEGLKASGWL